MSYLTRLREKLPENDYSGALTKPTEPRCVSFVGTRGKGCEQKLSADSLPSALLRGLKKLQSSGAPDISQPNLWPQVVSDAVRLLEEGWVERALALGWSLLDLWGASPELGGNVDHEGLAVWLAGRRILLLDQSSCTVRTGPNRWSVFNRRPVPGAVFLWEIGRATRS